MTWDYDIEPTFRALREWEASQLYDERRRPADIEAYREVNRIARELAALLPEMEKSK